MTAPSTYSCYPIMAIYICQAGSRSPALHSLEPHPRLDHDGERSDNQHIVIES